MNEFIGNVLFSRKMIVGATLAVILAIGGLWLTDPDAFPIKSQLTEAGPPDSAADVGPPLSEAERIAHLQRSLETSRKYLDSLNAQLKDPNSEFNRAEKWFQKIDAERDEARQAIQDLKGAGKTAEAAAREASLKDLETRWQQARDRFNLAIKEHKTLQESIDALTHQIQEDQQALDRLSGAAPAAGNSTSPGATATARPNASPAAEGTTAAKPAQAPAPKPSPLPLPDLPFSLIPSSAASSPASPPVAGGTQPTANVSREMARAQEDAKAKEDEAKKAEDKAQSITERIEALGKNISLTKKLLETDRQEADHAQQTKNTLDAELQQKMAAKAPEAELANLSRRIEFAQRRFQEALDKVRSTTDHLHELQSELSALQAEQIAALRDADAKKQAAEAAEDKIAQLQNPFRPRNVVHWLFQHGPRLVLIAIGMLVFHRLSRILSRRVVRIMSQAGTAKRGTHQDRENRAQTLVGVFSSALALLVLGGGTLMILDEVGIPIVPLMGGAAVLGLAVAFGAQNLIKDYFSGFMVLLEDQYGINDVVKIGTISGLVEHISLRTTVLRDLEGVVHFIPHGTITTVSNLTHGWSRALFDIDIAYTEDIDRVMKVLIELGRELRQDPMFGPLILDDPEMLGVDELADSSVIVKFFIKTCPLQQWTVKREMLRRIKNRFDQLGIEIPYPHQTVHHRYDEPPPSAAPPTAYAPPPVKRVG
jgi:small conductance mechanosensitive channel